MHKCRHMYTCNYIFVSASRSYTCTIGRPRMRVPTRLCTHTRACTSAAPPRTTARAASTTRPSASRLRWRAARAEKAAHTPSNVVTAAVFHAPMFALNADAE